MKATLTVQKSIVIPIKHGAEGDHLGDVLMHIIMDHLEYENSRSEHERAELSKIEVSFDDDDRARFNFDENSRRSFDKNYKVVQ